MKVTCPKCESEDVQRLAMIYQHGTATSVSTGTTLAAVGDDLAVAGTVTSGKQQSLLAQQAAPPEQKSESTPLSVIGIFVIAVGGGLPIVGAIGMPGFETNSMPGRAAWFVLCGLIVVAGITMYRVGRASDRIAEEYNRTTYPRLKEQWERTWLCLRCGNRFEANV